MYNNYYGLDDSKYELKHYGVKGMKWRNHKYAVQLERENKRSESDWKKREQGRLAETANRLYEKRVQKHPLNNIGGRLVESVREAKQKFVESVREAKKSIFENKKYYERIKKHPINNIGGRAFNFAKETFGNFLKKMGWG